MVNVNRYLRTNPNSSIFLIRLTVGVYFLFSAMPKLQRPADFVPELLHAGFLMPEFVGSWLGSLEMICGALILFGFLTRVAVIPLMVVLMISITTLIPVSLADGPWALAHILRGEVAILLACLFLFINGADRRSFDRRFFERFA